MVHLQLLSALSRRVASAMPTQTAKPNYTLKGERQERAVKRFWLLIAAVFALLILVRITRAAFQLLFGTPSAPVDKADKPEGEVARVGRTGKASWRRTPSALAAGFRILAFRTTIPIGPGSVSSVAELTFICGYIAAIFTFLLTNTSDLEQFYFEDRAAHLASCQLPLIVALAGKNNVISWLTGIGHEKLNVLHRAAARTCLILVWMHAIIRLVAGLPEKFDFTHDWMISGLMGLTAFTAATILSIRPIRQLAFEFFLITHIILIAIFLICAYFHTRDPGFGTYVWPALLVWAFDRSLRMAGLVWNNRLWRLGTNEASAAQIELLGKDTVRLTLKRRFGWKAGQHAYIILPSVSGLPTEAHPFTIANIAQPVDGSKASGEQDVTFVVRARQGFTGRLRVLAATGPTTVPAYIDGPYGCPPDLRRFSTCLLIAGGSGVSYTLSLLMDIIRHANKKDSSVRRAVFVWVIRDVAHLSWISETLNAALAHAPRHLIVEPRIYVTRKSRTSPIPSLSWSDDTPPPSPSESLDSPPSSPDEKSAKTALPLYSSMRVFDGRPDVQQLLDEEVTSAAGPVSVDVAGPSALASTVRNALRSELARPLAVLKGRQPVELHVETFGMVKG